MVAKSDNDGLMKKENRDVRFSKAVPGNASLKPIKEIDSYYHQRVFSQTKSTASERNVSRQKCINTNFFLLVFEFL